MEPALTPEEWARALTGKMHPDDMGYMGEAALLLQSSGDDFGPLFTWEDVDRLRRNAYNVPDGWSGNPWMEELADRIAALLPPRE